MIDVNEIIKVLNLCKIRVLEMYHPLNRKETLRYFAVESFFEPLNQTQHYSIKGYDITKIITENSLSVHTIDLRNREAVVLSKIEELKLQHKEYGRDYTYELYITVSD